MIAAHFSRLKTKVSQLHWGLFIAYFVGLRLIVAVVFVFLVQLTGHQSALKGIEEFDSAFFTFAVILIIAPLIETYLMQHLPFQLLSSKIHPLYICALSSVLFGAMHHYSLLYILHGVFGGIVYSLAYYFKRQSNPSFFVGLQICCKN